MMGSLPQNGKAVKAGDAIAAKKSFRNDSWSTTNQSARSAESGSTQAKAKLWRQPRTRSQPPMRQRNFEPIYAPGVTPGI